MFIGHTLHIVALAQVREKAMKNRSKVAQGLEKLQHQQRQEVSWYSNIIVCDPMESLSDDPIYYGVAAFCVITELNSHLWCILLYNFASGCPTTT